MTTNPAILKQSEKPKIQERLQFFDTRTKIVQHKKIFCMNESLADHECQHQKVMVEVPTWESPNICF